MEIQQLKGFQAVAKYGNFTIAARKTLRTQPTISLQIKALEDELGIKLFERIGHKRAKLTPEGQILLDLTAPLLENLETIPLRFNESRGIFAKTKVTVVTHRAVMVYCLPVVIKKFKSLFPDCQLTILNRDREEILSMLADGEADFGISSLEAVPAGVDYRVFCRINRILIASKDHALSKRKSVTLEDLASYPLILPNKESHTRRKIDRVFNDNGIGYELTMEVAGRDAIKTYVGMGLGISIMNEYFVSPEDRKRLFIRDMSHYFGKSETGVLVRKGKLLSQPASEFINIFFEKGFATAMLSRSSGVGGSGDVPAEKLCANY